VICSRPLCTHGRVNCRRSGDKWSGAFVVQLSELSKQTIKPLYLKGKRWFEVTNKSPLQVLNQLSLQSDAVNFFPGVRSES
jgi:hypothetical protein